MPCNPGSHSWKGHILQPRNKRNLITVEKAVLEGTDIKKESKVEERQQSGEKCAFVFDWFRLFCWVICWQIVVMTPGLCSESLSVFMLWSQTWVCEPNLWNRFDPVWFSRTHGVAVSLGYCLMDEINRLIRRCTVAAWRRHPEGSTSPDWLKWVETAFEFSHPSVFHSRVDLNKVAKFGGIDCYPPNWFCHLPHCTELLSQSLIQPCK